MDHPPGRPNPSRGRRPGIYAASSRRQQPSSQLACLRTSSQLTGGGPRRGRAPADELSARRCQTCSRSGDPFEIEHQVGGDLLDIRAELSGGERRFIEPALPPKFDNQGLFEVLATRSAGPLRVRTTGFLRFAEVPQAGGRRLFETRRPLVRFLC